MIPSFFFSFVELLFELRASHLQSRHSTSWAHSQSVFALVILEMGGGCLMNYLSEAGLEMKLTQPQLPK
jgi:hypothetical protein